jgi:hypothetical protein
LIVSWGLFGKVLLKPVWERTSGSIVAVAIGCQRQRQQPAGMAPLFLPVPNHLDHESSNLRLLADRVTSNVF